MDRLTLRTRKEKHHLEGNAIPAGRKEKVLCKVIPVNSYLNCNHTTYLAQTVSPIVYVLEHFYRKFANLVAPTIDETIKHVVRCNMRLVL